MVLAKCTDQALDQRLVADDQPGFISAGVLELGRVMLEAIAASLLHVA